MKEELDHTKMGKDHCPACNYESDSASVVSGQHQVPVPGDVSMCLNCGEWLEFASDMALIPMQEKTRRELDNEVLEILRNGTDYIKKRGLIK